MISLVKCQKVTSLKCLETCVKLAAKVFSEISGNDFQKLLNEYSEWLDLKDNIFIIAKSPSEEIIGFLRIIPKEISFPIGLINTARFENIFIVPSYRGMNISRVLIDYAIEVSVENNMALASVMARRGVDNFYPKFGFHGVSCYPKVRIKLSDLKRNKIENKKNYSINVVGLEDLDYISKLYDCNYKNYFGSSSRTLNNWDKIFSYCKKNNIRFYKIVNNSLICAYIVFHENKVMEVFYNSFSSIIHSLIEVMNKYDEIIFHHTVDHKFFKSLKNIDLNFGIRSCPYGGHMIAVTDIKLITKNFNKKFLNYLIKSNMQDFSYKTDNLNLIYKKGNLKVDLSDYIKTKDLKIADIEIFLGIKSIYGNHLNGFFNYFYFPDLDQII